MADVTRREFLKVTGASLAGSSLVLLGFSPTAALAEVREFKLARATETRNTCPYCAVACGVLMYSLGDRAKNARSSIFHIEGDPDHPVNRGTLCPKGAALIDFIHSPSRLTRPDGGRSCPDVWPWSDDESLGRHQECRRRSHHGRQRRRGPSLRLQVGHRGEGAQQGAPHRRRPALHPLSLRGRRLCAHPHRH